ncbi:hypothetical protein OKA05_20005 [Luteolibacter arcticus]|uniref:Uncharacterized protein n=1 Tax=Luteolibacter arcticus TaxID=1581411 RepID=A0ABT3GMY2_9BACT|nr:hypothetical protein [Luteolibacter arcticus]MCW1924857.1 hypothetical protein [Luteolibacter arcticus]
MHYMLPPAMAPAPRKFPFLDQFSYLKIVQPEWSKRNNMNLFFKNYPRSLSHGRLVLAAIVQANNQLFQPGANDCPAVLVLDLEGEMKPEQLIQLAHRIFDLRQEGTATTEREQQLADYLNAESLHGFGMPVPETMGPESCRITAVFIVRKHLPGGHLQSKILPVCVNPDNGVAVVLPVKYWS